MAERPNEGRGRTRGMIDMIWAAVGLQRARGSNGERRTASPLLALFTFGRKQSPDRPELKGKGGQEAPPAKTPPPTVEKLPPLARGPQQGRWDIRD